jgi:hypothetical protein
MEEKKVGSAGLTKSEEEQLKLLPREVLKEIFGFTASEDLVNLALTSRLWESKIRLALQILRNECKVSTKNWDFWHCVTNPECFEICYKTGIKLPNLTTRSVTAPYIIYPKMYIYNTEGKLLCSFRFMSIRWSTHRLNGDFIEDGRFFHFAESIPSRNYSFPFLYSFSIQPELDEKNNLKLGRNRTNRTNISQGMLRLEAPLSISTTNLGSVKIVHRHKEDDNEVRFTSPSQPTFIISPDGKNVKLYFGPFRISLTKQWSYRRPLTEVKKSELRSKRKFSSARSIPARFSETPELATPTITTPSIIRGPQYLSFANARVPSSFRKRSQILSNRASSNQPISLLKEVISPMEELD